MGIRIHHNFRGILFVQLPFVGTGKLQRAEYDEQMEEAARQREELMAKNAAFVTVENVVAIKDASALAEGKAVFEKNCVACHRADGGGNVGPNLTDEYWIHGGGIKNVFARLPMVFRQKE